MGGILSYISKLIWGDSQAQRQPQLNVDDNMEGEEVMEQIVAQVSEIQKGEYVSRVSMDPSHAFLSIVARCLPFEG